MPAATDALIDGVYAHRLAERAREQLAAGPSPVADRVVSICRQIEAELRAQVADLEPVLVDAGVRIDGIEPIAGRQNHTITFLVADATTAEAGVAALEPHGFSRWERWQGGALESFRRSADQITAARTDDATTVVRFRWRARRHRNLLDRVLRPTSGDWSIVGLPRWAWWGYSIVRPVRLVAERAGLRPKHHASLGPFLATPDSLLDPLFDHVQLGQNDVIVDLGAGDGRIAVEAARRRGCRAVAVEQEPDLVELARSRRDAADVAELVTIVCGDARVTDLDDATVVVMFLPIDVVADIIDHVLARMSTGARLIVHEQSRLPSGLSPDTSTLLLGDNAATVAHVWHVP